MKRLFIAIMLLSAGLFANESEPQLASVATWGTPISYKRCDTCGRDVPSWMGITIHPVPYWPATSNHRNAASKAMFPYDLRQRFVCMRCIYERLGLKPDWQMPGEGE